ASLSMEKYRASIPASIARVRARTDLPVPGPAAMRCTWPNLNSTDMAFSRSKTVGIGVPDRESYSLALWSTHKSYPLRTGEVGCLSAIPVACGARPKGVIGLTGPLGYPTRLKLGRPLVILANRGILPRRNGRVVLICPHLALISILRLVIALGGTL